jgi:threonine dehydratase
MSVAVEAPTIEDIRAAETRLTGLALRTPLIRLNYPDTPANIDLKLESLQPIGVFKIRSIGNILKSMDAESLRRSLYTASTGSAGYALAWLARRLNIPATIFMPDTAPEGKRASIKQRGAEIKILSYEDWWTVICNHGTPNQPGLFVDPVCDPVAAHKSLARWVDSVISIGCYRCH